MLSTGYPSNVSTKTEVIDLEDSNVVCKDLDNFPIELYGSVGGNLASIPIICGGEFYNGSLYSFNKCYKYKEGGWQHFVTMIDRRSGAAGIVYDNALHIFGGFDYNEETPLKSSEIINEDGSTTEGPQLPEKIVYHAMASINSTLSVLTGGYSYDDTITDRTWYFSHTTQQFQPGPNLLERRNWHSSATITNQETKERILVVAGGYRNSDGFLSSTELLINGEWETGKNHSVIICFIQLERILLLSGY